MAKFRKGLIFTSVLAVIALIELMIVLYNLITPGKDRFILSEAEIVVPERQVIIKPFLFEQRMVELKDNIFNQLYEDISFNLMNKINTYLQTPIHDEPKVSENAPLEEDEDEHLSQLEEQLKASKSDDEQKPLKPRGSVMLAVVIDDMGVSVSHTKDILSLEKPMTASFLTYGAADRKQVMAAKKAGFEVMLHVPMMPHVREDLAPITLSPEMDELEIKNHLIKMLVRYDGLGLKGINNHMGSLFTEDAQSMGYVMQILKERNLFFLDSKTTSKSAAKEVAEKYGVPYIARDVFLDNQNDYDYIMAQLAKAEKIAHMRGYAVAICHPRSQTYKALRDWVKDLDKRHVRLVHLHDLVREVNRKS